MRAALRISRALRVVVVVARGAGRRGAEGLSSSSPHQQTPGAVAGYLYASVCTPGGHICTQVYAPQAATGAARSSRGSWCRGRP